MNLAEPDFYLDVLPEDSPPAMGALRFARDQEGLVTVADADGVIRFANERFCRTLGFDYNELVGQGYEILTAGGDPVTFRDEICRSLQRGVLWQGDVCLHSKDGRKFWLATTTIPFRNHKGVVSHFVVLQTDVTAHRQIDRDLSALHLRMHQIAAQVPGVIYQYQLRPDGTSCLPYASEGIRDVFRLAPEDVRDDAGPIFALLHPADYDGSLQAIEDSAQTLRPWRHEFRVRFPDGEVRWLLGNANPTRQADGSTLWNGFITDITEQRKQRDASAAEQARLAAFVEHAPAAIAMFDQQMRYIAVSRRWLTDNGLDGQSLVGLCHYDVFPTVPERWKETHRRCLLGDVGRCDDDVWEPGEKPQHLRWEVRPWFHAAGEIGGVMMYTEDITPLKMAEAALLESKEQFERAVRGSNDGIWDWNVVTGEVYYSPRLREQLGYSFEEFPDRYESWDRILHEEDRESTLEAIRRHLEENVPFDVIYRLRTRSGSWTWCRARGMAVRDADGKPCRMAGCISDISKLKQAEFALAEQAAKLSRARDDAEAANIAKSAFLANMSHEIRTPMTAILGYAELLCDRELLRDEIESHATTIKRAGKHLLTIINDILDLSKIEAGRMTVEQIPMSPLDVVQEVITVFRPQAAAQGLDLNLLLVGRIPRTIQSDPVRLRQILVNLVGNALKFTERGRVDVIVRLATDADDPTPRLAFEVRDTGIGMTPDEMAQLFRPFTQADVSTTRRFGGTGLGLTICQRMAQLLGGHIFVSSEPGRGSVFVTLIGTGSLAGVEVLSTDHLPRNSTGAIPQVLRTKLRLSGRVLLAEDGPLNQQLIIHLLRRHGADVDIAENGRVALHRLLEAGSAPARSGRSGYDLILMDMQMPELDGYATTAVLRQLGFTGPIVALTAHAMPEDRDKCLSAGCDDYVSKPIDRERLISVCHYWMTRENARRTNWSIFYGRRSAPLLGLGAVLPSVDQRICNPTAETSPGTDREGLC